MIEAGHDPIFPQNQNLFYTVYGDDRIHDFRHGPTEFPSFCFDSRQALPENVWHHYEVIASDDGTVGYLNGEEANVKYNFGKKEDIAFFSAGREHQEIKLGFGYWFDKENYLKGEIGDIKIYR